MGDRQFRDPESVLEAQERMLSLSQDVMNIERQLAEPPRGENDEYRRWRSKAHGSLVYKKSEHAFLKHWVTERRRQIEAGKLDIFHPNDPREILVRTRQALKKALDGDTADLGPLYNVIDQYLQHAA